MISRLAGVDCGFTKKVHWTRYNIFPYNSFRWRGIDGSEVLTHIIPQDRDYNFNMTANEMRRAEENFVEKDILDEFLCTFGVGDGGAGP